MSETMWDAPNQQVVRDDHSAPWEEGNGGTPSPPEDRSAGEQLEDMTKDELLAYADDAGVTPANAGMTKAQLIDGIVAAGAAP